MILSPIKYRIRSVKIERDLVIVKETYKNYYSVESVEA